MKKSFKTLSTQEQLSELEARLESVFANLPLIEDRIPKSILEAHINDLKIAIDLLRLRATSERNLEEQAKQNGDRLERPKR